MRKIDYSEFDLDGFTVKELQRICRYYGLEFDPKWKKDKLIKIILAYSPKELVEKTLPQHPLDESFFEVMFPSLVVRPEVIEPPVIKSVRVQRIEESTKKGN